jgi:hypothetical protein
MQKCLLFTVRAFLNIFSQLAEADVSETLKNLLQGSTGETRLATFPSTATADQIPTTATTHQNT